jgi:hypothetical protein
MSDKSQKSYKDRLSESEGYELLDSEMTDCNDVVFCPRCSQGIRMVFHTQAHPCPYQEEEKDKNQR